MVGAALRIYMVAGEESGDHLGAGLIAALRRRLGPATAFFGVGGHRMAAEGLKSLFPISDVAVIGISGVIAGLPRIMARIKQTAGSIVASQPDILIIIDSPDFTHRVARRVRRQLPGLKIIDYVSPTVWAWRPGRAAAMSAYVDRVLALFPFEPEAHRRLGGPACTYVGHPLIEHLDRLRPAAGERVPLAAAERPVLLVLPGSRRGEIDRHMAPFGAALGMIREAAGPFELLLPTIPHLLERVQKAAADWPVKPAIFTGEAEKYAAFRRAHAALAASGTVTLELALSGVPMAVGYQGDWLMRPLRWLVSLKSIVLPNLIVDENAIPEFMFETFSPAAMAAAVAPLLAETAERSRQLNAFGRLDQLIALPDGVMPSDKAAEVVVAELGREGGRA